MLSSSFHGGALLFFFSATWLLYYIYRNKIVEAYHETKKVTRSFFVNFFLVSETIATLSWLSLSIVLLSLDVQFAPVASYAMIVGALMHGIGSVLWPILLQSNYATTTAFKFPNYDDVAIVAAAVGSITMTIATAFVKLQQYKIATLALSAYMTFHFVFVDVIGWMVVRYKYNQKKIRLAQTSKLLSAFY